MALSIKRPEVDDLVRELCALTGESMTSAIEVALRERLERLSGDRASALRRGVHEIQRDFAHVTWAQVRAAQEEMYDDSGLPR
jgi:antitoxin VapB